MASVHSIIILSCVLLLSLLTSSSANPRMLKLIQEQPLVLTYHKGPLLKGNITVNLIWYGTFTSNQRSTIVDFINSLSSPSEPPKSPPSVSSWWKITDGYKGGSSTVVLGNQIQDLKYSVGKSLKDSQLVALAAKAGYKTDSINVVLTAADVVVDDFCMNRCGSHGSGFGKPRDPKSKFAYAWVGNPVQQCPGYCAWPFHTPVYGPQTTPLIAPNGDIGADAMIINLATVLAGTVTNPFDNGYFQGPASAPLEAVSACTGIFGSGAYPGYPGQLLVDKATKASYNAVGVKGREYLLPAMWDPLTSTCKTLV